MPFFIDPETFTEQWLSMGFARDADRASEQERLLSSWDFEQSIHMANVRCLANKMD